MRLVCESTGVWVQMLETSVLDEASSLPHTCPRVVAHPYSRAVVSDFFFGRYRGTQMAIDPTTSGVALCFFYVPLHLLNLLCFLRLPSCMPIDRLSFKPLFSKADLHNRRGGSSDIGNGVSDALGVLGEGMPTTAEKQPPLKHV